ncbi:cation:proton antiporter [Paracoccus seriniphilus]|uniref:Sodium/proton antiporter, CPA1 family n=1 Tax=Paracoccus seriniphilus TaxID=184748 RepID=A0A239PM02_9RHOB|nr:sodium:proton antiporter [Paracoccus seriniphilus]WCR13596.1 sodium:proton antiporter [Paracoccus seriniphilus]SNT68816.1 sodium/proton antiporter, CPA1 family [Paracoccus seriniphilus]
MATELTGGLSAMQAFAVVGIAGVGAQWLAWRFRLPAIVLMLAAGLFLGPVTEIFVPSRDIGDVIPPMIALAVAVILFEGGLTLSFKKLADARPGVRRLVYIGAPLGWLMSSLALVFVAGLGWESAIVFGGIMIVTGPTVIAPLLRQAKLTSRPAQILQWEGIVNDPIGALVAVFALEIVLVRNTGVTWGEALAQLVLGIGFAAVIGVLAGYMVVQAFRRGWVPEYMKVPLLFVTVLGVFAGADSLLHESGLLAVTVMGLVIANADLPSYHELHRFKEHATILLVSGVFILLAASIRFETLAQLNWWRAGLFVASVVLIARPVTVMLSLIGTNLPIKERLLIALTGPRGVVLVAVSGIFAERLVNEGIEDGALIAPLAFVLVLVTVVLHGFTLAPLARRMGLTSGDRPGLLIVGGSLFATGLAKALEKADVNVLITDTNRDHLRTARAVGVQTFYGDILGDAAEHNVEFIAYGAILAASDNDAYNTLVATDLAPEFGRDSIWQLARHKEDRARHALPTQLGGQTIEGNRTLAQYLELLGEGWIFRTTRLTEEYRLEAWREARPGAIPLAVVQNGQLWLVNSEDDLVDKPDIYIVSMLPPDVAQQIEQENEAQTAPKDSAREVARAEAEAVRRGEGSGSVPGGENATAADRLRDQSKDDPDLMESQGDVSDGDRTPREPPQKDPDADLPKD